MLPTQVRIFTHLKTKKAFVNQVHQGMSVSDVSKMYNISRCAVNNWIKHPDKYLDETRSGLKPYDLEIKVEVLRLVDEGDLTVCQIADLKQISESDTMYLLRPILTMSPAASIFMIIWFVMLCLDVFHFLSPFFQHKETGSIAI